jgi:hypothetical protein
MISKIAVAIILSVATLLFAAPANAFAASSNKTQIAKLLKQLKSLPKGGATSAQVSALVTKLAKLDPAKANTYVKTGLSKLDPVTAKSTVSALGKKVDAIIKSSSLPDSVKAKIILKSDKVIDGWKPAPTPTPYQAMLPGGEVVA